MQKKTHFIGFDLFSGAGGLALGAEMAGIKVINAIEFDKNAAATYSFNHAKTNLIVDDIVNVKTINKLPENKISILFGGPPCQGFSISNQRTRNKKNPSNWLLLEFIRIAKIIMPDWIVFENVKGIIETEKGFFRDYIIKILHDMGYKSSWNVLCSSNFGVPQYRARFFLIASKHGYSVEFPENLTNKKLSVKEAIGDLPSLENGSNIDYLPYKKINPSKYAKTMRISQGCTGHLVTKNAPYVIERYPHIKQGGNWSDIPEKLMENYNDRMRCHSGIYYRLDAKEPAITIGNYRKAMLIHPWENRGLSVREAARLQSFPDSYVFKGSMGFQQQQVGNAVPPLLAKAVFSIITNGDYSYERTPRKI